MGAFLLAGGCDPGKTCHKIDVPTSSIVEQETQARRFRAVLIQPGSGIARILAVGRTCSNSQERTEDSNAIAVRRLPEAGWSSIEGASFMQQSERARSRAPVPITILPLQRLQGDRLPVVLTSLVGRDDDIVRVRALIDQPNLRLLTLVGGAGLGKTRLAIAVAESYSDASRRPIFADLTSTQRATRLIAAVARSCGIPEVVGEEPGEVLAAAIGQQEMLLVLDNLEHLVEGCPALIPLLQACPHLTILATSRSRLGISGETIYRVRPLAARSGDDADSDTPAAVQLFIERADSVFPAMDWTPSERGAVAELCERLGGEPLAIELAASRVRHFPPSHLLDRAGPLLGILEGGVQDAPARQRSMRAAIRWSYELVSTEARPVFRALGVFAGPFPFGHAVSLLERALPDRNVGAEERTVGELIDQHLLNRTGPFVTGERLAYHQAVREFALEQARALGELEHIQAAHVECILAAARSYSQADYGPERRRMLLDLEASLPDLRSAKRWLLAHDRARDVIELGLDLRDLGWNLPHTAEVRALLEDAVSSEPTIELPRLADALSWIALMAVTQGDDDAAIDAIDRAWRMAGVTGNVDLQSHVARLYGMVIRSAGNSEEAIVWFRLGLELARQSGAWRRVVTALIEFGVTEARLQRPGSGALLNEAWQIADAEHYALGKNLIRCSRAATAIDAGELPRARSLLAAALDSAIEECDAGLIAEIIFLAADLCSVSGKWDHAAMLAGAAEAERNKTARRRFRNQPRFDRLVERLSRQLGWDGFESTASRGAGLPAAQIWALARTVMENGAAAQSAGERGKLSRRELEVLQLLAEGRSDREIAQALYISRPTASHHVQSILNKLSVASRAAAAARGIQSGMVRLSQE
jgi:predicted ATPase/DNA-binding CsgD family transcriptional regulator